MRLKTAFLISALAFAALVVEVIVYIRFDWGFFSAFHGDFRATYLFLPLVASTAAALLLAPVVVGISRVVRKPGLAAPLLCAIVGLIGTVTVIGGVSRLVRVTTIENRLQKLEANLPRPPELTYNADSSGGDSLTLEDVVGVSDPRGYWHHTILKNDSVGLAALVYGGPYTQPGEFEIERFPHVVILAKVILAPAATTKSAVSLFFDEPILSRLYSREDLVFGIEKEIEVSGKVQQVIEATYKGAPGVAGKIALPDGDLVFLMWAPRGEAVRLQDIAWLFTAQPGVRN